PAAVLLKELAELALPPADDGGEDLEARPRGPGEELVHDLARRLPAHRATAVRTVGRSAPRPEEAQGGGDRGHGPDRAAGVAPRRLLRDGNGRGEPPDHVDVGLLHDAQELTGVRGERLDVTALAFGVDGVEGQRGLAGAREAGDDDEAIAGEL